MADGLKLDDALDQEVFDLMANGPEDQLHRTIYAQQAVFAVTAALWDKAGLDQPEVVMGHSLGEYMALTASGAITPQDAQVLVKNRATYMENAMPPGTGGMAAVIGLSYDEVSSLIQETGDVWVANINQERQIVISGAASALRDVVSRLKNGGARRVIPLNVSVASHCPYMDPARTALEKYLQTVEVNEPVSRVVFNASAREESDPQQIKALLAEQLVVPVRWKESVQYAYEAGIRHFIEIGPKSVLAPMIKRILPDVRVEVITGNGN